MAVAVDLVQVKQFLQYASLPRFCLSSLQQARALRSLTSFGLPMWLPPLLLVRHLNLTKLLKVVSGYPDVLLALKEISYLLYVRDQNLEPPTKVHHEFEEEAEWYEVDLLLLKRDVFECAPLHIYRDLQPFLKLQPKVCFMS